MTILYELYHWHIGADEHEGEHVGEPDEKRIGIFSTEEKAAEVARVLREKPGFRRWPYGVRIYQVTVDNENYGWKGGFMSIDEMDEDEESSPPAP